MSAESSRDARPFFGRVESVRGLGAVLVAGFHMSGWGAPQGTLLPQQPWAGVGPIQNVVGQIELHVFAGHAALMVFFVISGIVLRVSLGFGPQAIGPAALRFHIARLFRIYPIVIVGMLVAALTYVFRGTPGQPPLSAGMLIANLLLLRVSLNTTLWAIQLEVVMAPFIVLLYWLERWRGPWAVAAVAVVASGLAFGNWVFWRPLSENFFAFALGMLLPTIGRRWMSGLTRRQAGLCLIASVLGLFLPWALFGFYSKFSAVTEGYAAAILVCGLAYRADLPVLQRLDWRPLRVLGRASGSYYVLHMSVLPWIYPLVLGLVPASLWVAWPSVFAPLIILLTLALFAPLAVLSYYLVESPGIALGRRFTDRRAPAAAAERQSA